MKSILEISGLSVRRDHALLLDMVNWCIAPGENWVLFGPNGAGKTTLLSVITGYTWPTSGNVRVLGHQFGETDMQTLRRIVPIVSDSVGAGIHGNLSGLEVLITGARAHLNMFDPPSYGELRRAAEIAEMISAHTLLDIPYSVMSTGERQRLLIGRALMAYPHLLILDEPCAGLDIAGREFVLHTIHSVASSDKAPPLIMTTHHVEEITPAFTHALVLQKGRIFTRGTIGSVLTSRTLSDLFGISLRAHHRKGRWSVAPTA
ncbi:MAG: ATP-binding cassette domain-containing protein [Candidatus Sumerlaeota bacterium]|nr:ATP-binding cassette domain-containing protein [Candidatus Sumerlaeota bacterium]